jgi:large conductance mechanosensitive channel
MKGFRAFLLRGNVIDLAIAVVIGAAFGVVVTALVKDLITPLIAAIGGKPDFANLTFTVNKSIFRYGDFINAVIAFFIIAAVVYYFVVVPYVRFRDRVSPQPKEDVKTRDCPYCLSSIPEAATRCAFCTSEVAGTGTTEAQPAL